jgi:hypothetical protein
MRTPNVIPNGVRNLTQFVDHASEARSSSLRLGGPSPSARLGMTSHFFIACGYVGT